MKKVRLNISLPTRIANQLKMAAAPRDRSAIVAEALERFLTDREVFTKNLIEDYQSTTNLSLEDKEWIDSDLEQRRRNT